MISLQKILPLRVKRFFNHNVAVESYSRSLMHNHDGMDEVITPSDNDITKQGNDVKDYVRRRGLGPAI